MWIASRDEVLGLQNDFDDARRAVASIEERLPAVRDIVFWVRDPAAGLPFNLFCEAIGATCEETARELSAGCHPTWSPSSAIRTPPLPPLPKEEMK